jgi:hypothetical protein
MLMRTSILALAALLASTSAKATLVNEGDYARDTITGLEWLNLRLTSSISYNDVVAGYGGWTSSGWSVATVFQVNNLVTTYVGPQVFSNPTDDGHVGYSYFYNAKYVALALGNNFGQPDQSLFSAFGFFGDGGLYGAEIEAVPGNQPPLGEWAYNLIDAHPDQPYYQIGTFLVRQGPIGTPETSTWAMMLLGFAGLGYAGYRRTREPRAAA